MRRLGCASVPLFALHGFGVPGPAEVLGLEEGTPVAAITAAFRQLARRIHPDKVRCLLGKGLALGVLLLWGSSRTLLAGWLGGELSGALAALVCVGRMS